LCIKQKDMVEKLPDGSRLQQLENSLQQGSDFFRFLSDSCPIGIFSTNTEGCCTYINARCRSIWGCTSEEILGQSWVQFVHPEDRLSALEDWSNCVRERCEVSRELRCQTAQGQVRWIHLRSSPLFDQQGNFMSYVSTVEDITDKQVEREQLLATGQAARAEAARVQQQLSTIFETSPIGIGLLDHEQRFVAINEALAEINGLSRQQHLGHSISDLFANSDPNLVKLFDSIYATGELFISSQLPVSVPGRNDRRPGYYSVYYLPTQNRSGTVQEVLVYVVDVTDRVRLEQGRRFLSEASSVFASSLDYQTTLEQVARLSVFKLADWCVVHVVEEDGSIQELATAHVDPEKVLWAKELQQKYPLNPNAPRGAALTLRTGQSELLSDFSDELLVQIAHDAEHLQILRTLGLKSAMNVPLIMHQKILGVISFVSTESERQYVQADLALAEEIARRASFAIANARLYRTAQRDRLRAEAANRVKDEFLAVLSHELRTPLNPILGWTKLLRSRPFNPKAAEQALGTIERNARLLTQLIEDLLDVSRILQGKLSLSVQPVDVAEIVKAALETVHLAAAAKAIEIRSEVSAARRESDASPHLPLPFMVSGDAARLQQVVWNLLSNAIKFTPTGGRVEVKLERIRTERSAEGDDYEGMGDGIRPIKPDSSQPAPFSPAPAEYSPAPAEYAQITVTDTGKGIHSSFLPHVFEYFRQEDSKITRNFSGLGLGLAIVRHIVELHGGTVEVQSPGEDQGATFIVRLPTIVNWAAPAQQNHLAESVSRLEGIRILAVDDEEDMRTLLTFILQQAGATVTTVETAAQALATLKTTKPDLLLTDIAMPEVDGYGLLRQIRSLEPDQGGQTPAIAITAYAGELNQQRVLAAGFQHYISKPVDPHRLVQEIAQVLRQLMPETTRE
jgi:PAS domain S-box-containing protein